MAATLSQSSTQATGPWSGRILPALVQLVLPLTASNIWVANASGTVTKLKACDGSLVGTYHVASPWGIAFDGANIWVTNHESKYRHKAQGKRRVFRSESIKSTLYPVGIAFDGATIWVANYGSKTVTKLSAGDGSLIHKYKVGYRGSIRRFLRRDERLGDKFQRYCDEVQGMRRVFGLDVCSRRLSNRCCLRRVKHLGGKCRRRHRHAAQGKRRIFARNVWHRQL